jgi:flagellar hook-associated protein 1 FlgK
MGAFFNAFRELSNNPESLATRALVKETAAFLTKDFQRANSQLKKIQEDVDYQLVTHVQEINQKTKEIAQLNEKIQVVELQGMVANDERDRRDQILKDLGSLINIKYAEGENGAVTVTAGNTAVLVSGHEQRDLVASVTSQREGKREGNVEIFYKISNSSKPVNITKQITGGKMGGLLDARDVSINNKLDQLDELAYNLAIEVNRAHEFGFDRYNGKGDKFFVVPETKEDASEFLSVNKEIMKDVGKIAAGAEPNSPGDNRIANIISSLQYENTMGGSTSTYDDYYNTMVGEIGIEAQRASSYAESQKGVVKQLQNIRESVSGVSLDEETAKMIEFQKAFDASARLIRTADEMMDTVLNLKRI